MATLRDLLTASLRKIGVLPHSSVAPDWMIQQAKTALNYKIDEWNADSFVMYNTRIVDQSFAAGKGCYTLGINGDWDIGSEDLKLMSAVLTINPSPPASCNLVSSQEDANVFELWHFDEGIGATSTSAAVWVYEEAEESTITFGSPAVWSLQEGCCDTALFLGNDTALTEHTLSPSAGGGFIGPTLSLPDGYTIEFSLYNNGNTSPGLYDYIEVFRHDAISFGGGEGLVTIRGFKVGQDLYIVYGSDMDNGTLVSFPLAVDTCTAICIEGATGGSLSIYANGVRVLNIPMDNNDFWSTNGDIENNGGFIVFSNVPPFASELIIDEYRRSNIVRYDAATYSYTTG